MIAAVIRKIALKRDDKKYTNWLFIANISLFLSFKHFPNL